MSRFLTPSAMTRSPRPCMPSAKLCSHGRVSPLAGFKRFSRLSPTRPASNPAGAWRSYLGGRLSGFSIRISGHLLLLAMARQLWRTHPGLDELGKSFKLYIPDPYEAIPLLRSPLFRAQVPDSTATVLALEAIRQALVTVETISLPLLPRGASSMPSMGAPGPSVERPEP